MLETFVLHVRSAVGVVWRPRRCQTAKLYITVKYDSRDAKSLVSESLTPKWNFEWELTSASTRTEITIKLFYKSVFGPDKLLGQCKYIIWDLLKRCASGKMIPLNLKNRNNAAVGQVFVRLTYNKPLPDLPAATTPIPAKHDLNRIHQDIKRINHPPPLVDFAETVAAVSQAGGNLREGGAKPDPNRIHRGPKKINHPPPLVDFAETVAEVSQAGGNLGKGVWNVVSKLEPIVEIGDRVAKIHPYLNIAWQALTSVYQAAKKLRDTDEEVVKLVNDVLELYTSVGDIHILSRKIKSLETTVLQIEQVTRKCSELLHDYTSRNALIRGLRANLSVEFRNEINDLSEELLKLKPRFDRAVGIQTLLDTDTLKQSEALKRLRTATYDASQRARCLEGTRVGILKDIESSLASPSPERNVLWLWGVAGSGKSTIAASVAHHFYKSDAHGYLCAHVFFTRSKPADSDPIVVLHTLAAKLAELNPDIKAALCSALDKPNTLDIPDLHAQFELLLLGPINYALPKMPQVPIVIVLDGLDECQISKWRGTLVSLITDNFPRLPPIIRILITSRPNADIATAFRATSGITERELGTSVDRQGEDIQFYIQHRMETIRRQKNMPSDWAGTPSVENLATNAGGLFIWAELACDLVETAHNRTAQLERLTDPKSGSAIGLDGLYTMALQDSGNWDDLNFAADARAILGAIVFARSPLTDSDLDALLGLAEKSETVLSQLGCLIQWSPGKSARLLHSSFSDYLMNPKHSAHPWAIDTKCGKQSLALGCLRVLHDQLRFNICGLESSYLLNSEVEDLNERIQRYISTGLVYAAKYWSTHLGDADVDDEVLAALDHFLPSRFLYWLELSSLLCCVDVARVDLEVSKTVVKDKNASLEKFLGDALKYLDEFAPVISRSVPHIYLSSIPFLRPQSSIRTSCGTKLLNILDFNMRPSSNSARIVSGPGDQTIRIRDTKTGDAAQAPMEQYPTSVAFSPCGMRIMSNSGDSLYIRDAKTGTFIEQVKYREKGLVKSVVFSPSGARLVSNSRDHTIQIWDVETRALLHTLLLSLEDERIRLWDTPSRLAEDVVNHVMFSPDGTRIMTSGYRTICIWGTASEKQVNAPLLEHSDKIESIAFSHDGTQIVSASCDGTIRIWDTARGEAEGTVLQHEDREKRDSIRCVAFSPDNMHILSCEYSDDILIDPITIRTWDKATGKVIRVFRDREPPHGPRSSAFSPDGARIAVVSDYIVCMYDPRTGEKVTKPLATALHTRPGPIAFSPDGARIVFSSGNDTIHILDTCEVESSFWGPLTGLVDGWLLNSAAERMFWVPPWLRETFPFPWNPIIISPDGIFRLDISRFVHGKRWIECMQQNE